MAYDDHGPRLPSGLGRLPELPRRPKELALLSDVFGLQRGRNPKNYVERPGVDEPVKNALMRKQHIVIYGSSKQGKTCVRRRAVAGDASVVLSCQRGWTLADIHRNILREAGYSATASETETRKKDARVTGKLGAKAKFLVGESGIDVDAARGGSREYQVVRQPVSVDLEDANSIIAALRRLDFQKTVVPEEFHFLFLDTQRSFSEALKAYFEESDVGFILVGVWWDKNRLSQYHGDLTGRIVPVDADAWDEASLRRVIQLGEDRGGTLGSFRTLAAAEVSGPVRRWLNGRYAPFWSVMEIASKPAFNSTR